MEWSQDLFEIGYQNIAGRCRGQSLTRQTECVAGRGDDEAKAEFLLVWILSSCSVGLLVVVLDTRPSCGRFYIRHVRS
jgi:hypothetical protein